MDELWIKVDIFTTSEGLEPLGAALNDLGHSSFSVVDAADLDNLMKGKYGAWDYIDKELMNLGEAKTTITLYMPDDAQGQDDLALIHVTLSQLKASDSTGAFGRLECNVSSIKDENWADAWKDGYSPIIIGEKLIVCPTWGDCDVGERKVLRIDPGMAFGTGIDETTRLCLEALECLVEGGNTVLDIGCGSGILAIGALLLGAASAQGIDIDEVAVKTAKENSVLNGVSGKSEFVCGNPVELRKDSYDIVCANISADVILLLMPEFPRFLKNGGRLILSGIIKEREQDVVDALLTMGFSVLIRKEESGWVCIVACPSSS